jgi:hypothetical protein
MSTDPRASYAVAVSRWAAPIDEVLPTLAASLGITPYDLRLRVGGALPVILERTADADRARALLATLRGQGHGAVGCDVAAVPAADSLPRLRAFELSADELTLVAADGGRQGVPFAAVAAVVRALHVVEEDLHTQTTTRQLSVGRAVLTSGLSMTKQVVKETRQQREERQQVAYVYVAGAGRPWLLREHELRYDALGDRRGLATAAGFQALVAALGERAPRALHDDRFFRQRRRDPELRVAGNTAASTTRSSNVAATDLAVHLLVLAHVRGQL